MTSTLQVRNPYSNQVIQELPFHTEKEIDSKLKIAEAAFQKWRKASAWDRSQLLTKVAHRLEARSQEFAELICQEAGKPIALAQVEVSRALSIVHWAAAEAQRFGGELLRLDAVPNGRTGFGLHTRFPKGVILGITPFNFPLNLVIHKVTPSVACGCSILIKPSPYTPLTALRFAELFEDLMPGLVQVVLANDSMAAKLTQTPEIKMISFTGSSRVGWLIRRQAPEKPTTLELGGNAWVIIMEDTPAHLLPAIAKRISNGAFGYAGQSCISVQNVAFPNSLWNEARAHLQSVTENTPFGDPKISSVVTGPMMIEKTAHSVQKEISDLEAKGLKDMRIYRSQSANGSHTTHDPKNPTGSHSRLMAPTLVTFDHTPPADLPLVQDELFAPVMIAQPFTDLDSIIEKINSSRYGLQTGIYTQNWSVIEKLYRELEVGGVVVNDIPTTRYDHQPYGGVKDSGQGREGLRYAMEEMTESKFLALSSQVL